jgi:hypothetical protein
MINYPLYAFPSREGTSRWEEWREATDEVFGMIYLSSQVGRI